jgi:uncharacterized protein YjbJ (UPF0337 family)
MAPAMNRNEIKGKGRNLKGRVKQAAGAVTGKGDLERQGMADRVGGKVQEGIGKVERKLDKATSPRRDR